MPPLSGVSREVWADRTTRDLPFSEIWGVDFEYVARDGDRPVPVSLYAKELLSGRAVFLFGDELTRASGPPYPTHDGALFVAYQAAAELSCHAVLGWPQPSRILDLYVESRVVTNGRKDTTRAPSLLQTCQWFGVPCMAYGEKHTMRELILRGGPWTAAERDAIRRYNAEDVEVLEPLLHRMLPFIRARRTGLVEALFRGRYMAAVARMEHSGIPFDVPTFKLLRSSWDRIVARLIEDVDADYGVFEGGAFREVRFAAYLVKHGIPWPTLPAGQLDLRGDTFKTMVARYPQLGALHELRKALSQLRLNKMPVGTDGRHREWLAPFVSRSGRNQPSNSRFVFGPSRWVRGLIKPGPGLAIAYVDYAAQEVWIAAALSGDPELLAACESGDVHLSFANSIGMVPPDATKQSHPRERDISKTIILGTQYGMGPITMAHRAGIPEYEARRILRLHRQTYRVFWEWADAAVRELTLHNEVRTPLGWPRWADEFPNTRSAQNHPIQAAGSDILRLACCEATEAGLMIVAPIHDALLLESSLERIEADVEQLRVIMRRAAQAVVGIEIDADARIVTYPDRYMDERPGAREFWELATRLAREESERFAA